MQLIAHYIRCYKLLDGRIRLYLFVTTVLLIIVSVLDLLGLSMIFPIVKLLGGDTSILKHEKLRFIQPYLVNVDEMRLVVFLTVGFVAMLGLKAILAVGITYWSSKKILQAEARFTVRVFAAYLQAPLTYHLARNSAEFIRNLNGNCVFLFRHTAQSLVQLIAQMMMSIGLMSVLIYVDPWAAIFSLGILSCGGAVYLVVIGSTMSRMASDAHEISMHTFKVMQESMENFIIMKIFNRAKYFTNLFYKWHYKIAEIGWKQQAIGQLPSYMLEFMTGTMILAIIMFLFATGKRGEDVMTILILYAVAAIRLAPIVTRVVSTINAARSAIPPVLQLAEDVKTFGDEIIRDKDWNSSDRDVIAPGAIPSFKEQISIQDVSVIFSSGKKALSHINLDIKPGESIGLVGHSGAGKSTLVNVIVGLLEPQEGRVTFDGEPVNYNLPAIARSIGFVPQQVTLMDDSIRANVAFALMEGDIDDVYVNRALAQADLSSMIDALPEGLDTRVGERGMMLSGGQRQRIGIARALYYDPSILILDEATAALDVETEARISKVINDLSGKKTLIIIAHRLSTVQECDRIIFMDDGEIVDSGSFEELFTRNNEFKSMVDRARLGIDFDN